MQHVVRIIVVVVIFLIALTNLIRYKLKGDIK